MENTESYDDIAVCVVEVPVADHKKVEVVEAKERELKNLAKYGVFEEVEDNGQERISSRWVITKKEKADGQKTNYKGRLVARGVQEKSAPQSDSLTMLRESMKLFFSVAANGNFNLRSIDIIAAFLQAKELENLAKYGVFEEVEDNGQERISSRWVITKKEKADGQKTDYKGRLVACRFRRNRLLNLIHLQC